MSRASLTPVLLLVFVGCTANIPDGRFHCEMPSDCPSGLMCVDHRCYHPGTAPDGSADIDAGPGIDGGGPSIDAYVAVDAAPCVGASCVAITLTNAFGTTLDHVTGTIETTSVMMPAFGETSDPYSFALGTNSTLDVAYGMLHMSFMIAPGSSYAIVVGPSMDDPTMPTVQALPLSFTTFNPGQFQVTPVDMTSGGATYTLDGYMQTRTMTRGGTAPDAMVFMNDVRDPLEVSTSPGGVRVLLASFDSADFQLPANFYLVFIGRGDAHLAGPEGLRVIPVVPGAHLVGSAPVLFVFNATTGDLVLCDATSTQASLPMGQVIQGFSGVARGAPAGMPRSLIAHPSAEGCSGPNARPAGIPWRTASNPILGRVLLAFVGDLSGPMWGPGSGAEAPPASHPTVQQVITYGNGTMHMIGVGTVDDGIIGHAPGPGTAFHEWDMIPTTLEVDFGAGTGGLVNFVWNVPSPTAAVLAVSDGTLAIAYEFDTKFGQPWSLTPVPPNP